MKIAKPSWFGGIQSHSRCREFSGLQVCDGWAIANFELCQFSLMELEPMQQAHLCLYAGPTQDFLGLLSCLESIQASGCQELHCSGRACTGIQTSLNGCIDHYTSNL